MKNALRSFAIQFLVSILFFVDLFDDVIDMLDLHDTGIDDFSVDVRLGLYKTLIENFGIKIEEYDVW